MLPQLTPQSSYNQIKIIPTLIAFITLAFIVVFCINHSNYSNDEYPTITKDTSISRQPLTQAQQDITLSIETGMPWYQKVAKNRFAAPKFDFSAYWKGRNRRITITDCTKYTTFSDIRARLQRYWSLRADQITLYQDGHRVISSTKLRSAENLLQSVFHIETPDIVTDSIDDTVDIIDADQTHQSVDSIVCEDTSFGIAIRYEGNGESTNFGYYAAKIADSGIPTELIVALKAQADMERLEDDGFSSPRRASSSQLNNVLLRTPFVRDWIKRQVQQYIYQIDRDQINVNTRFCDFWDEILVSLMDGYYSQSLIHSDSSQGESFSIIVIVSEYNLYRFKLPIFSIDKKILTEFDEWRWRYK